MVDKELIERIIETEQRSKSNTHQIEDIKKDVEKVESKTEDIHRIATSIEIIANKMETQDKKITEIGEEVKAVKQEVGELKNTSNNEKAKNWDKLVWFIFTGVGGAIIGYIMNVILK